MFSFYGEDLLAPCPTLKLKDHLCQLSATDYVIHMEIPSKFGGYLLHLLLEDTPYCGVRDPLNMAREDINVPSVQ